MVENACFRVKPGDVFVIPPMTVHSYYECENLDVYHILIHKNFIYKNKKESNTIPGFLQLTEIEPFLRQNFSEKAFLHLTNVQLMQLKSDLQFIEDNNQFDTDEFIALKRHALWKILYWFSALLYRQMYESNEKTAKKHNIAILKALEFIHQNYGEKITIDLLSQVSYMSRSTFQRSFFAMCKCTPMEYVNRYRCKQALDMLDTSSSSKTEIAHCCGFYDLSHMERTIRHFER